MYYFYCRVIILMDGFYAVGFTLYFYVKFILNVIFKYLCASLRVQNLEIYLRIMSPDFNRHESSRRGQKNVFKLKVKGRFYILKREHTKTDFVDCFQII